MACSQATVVLTSKHFAQRQPWWLCVAAIPRSMAAVSNWSWMSPPSSWGLATSARPWGQSSQPPRGPWLPRAEPCPPPLGPCWPALSPWCWKLCSESSPMLSLLTGKTHTVGITHCFSWIIHFHLPAAICILLPAWLLLLSPMPPVSLVSVLSLLVLRNKAGERDNQILQSALYLFHTMSIEPVVKHFPLSMQRW